MEHREKAPGSAAPDFRPLDGVRVVDVSHVIADPFATLQLALLGAEVTKIESHEGYVMRRSGRGLGTFVALNGPKRKLRLDLTSAQDRRTVLALAGRADVFVDNLRPGSMDRLGLGFEAVRSVNPRIIYCSISGFGRAAGERPAYDHVVQAASGMTLATGAAADPPTKIGFPLIDTAACLLAAFAIVAGLRERDRSGAGLFLDVSMAGSAMQLMYPIASEAMTNGTVPARLGNQAFSGSPASNIFPTADGRWLAIAANTPSQMLALLRELGLGQMASNSAVFDPPLNAEAPAAFVRAIDPAAVKRALAAALALSKAAEIERRLIQAGVPVSMVRSLPEFTAEATAAGLLDARELTDGDTRVSTPGLGFTVRR